MAQQNPTIIVGHLDDSALKTSIDKLVNEVANKTTIMAGKFTSAIGKMQDAMKDFAITQKVSVDLMKEAWRDMSKSFDAMVAAQSGATGGGKGSGKAYAPNTIGALEQNIAELKQERKELELNSDALVRQNKELEKRKNLYKQQTTSPATKRLDNAMSLSTNKLDEAQKKLRLLEILQRRYVGTTELSVAQQNRLARAIQKTKEQIDKLKPKSLDDVLGMDAKSIDQIAAKMRALKMVQIDPNNTREVNRLGKAYADLKRQQAKMLGQNIQLTHSNNYLAQSFGYIRNRIVYALTLGAITNFVKQLYEIRGQYELLERSLGVLVGSFEKGTQIFNELNEMAIKSPFTLIELGTAAKQLTAYNFAANEVVDTTRRLADISAALGVPMERLTYNLGQIKAQGILNARDARDFANAGLAIVPMLAKMYTEQKTFGDEMVTTAQVYDMMSKKMVTYSDVLKVLYKVTDEGGKFFDFQAKQADTLRVQMANLTLAYNNMLNEIGSENQGILFGMVGGLKTLLKNWREISRAILTLVTTLGTYKAVATIVSALNSRMFVGRILINLRNYIAGIKAATGAMATFNAVTKMNPIAFLASALAAVVGYFVLFKNEVAEVSQEVEMFGESASKTISKVNTLKKVIDGTDETSNTYKKTLSELSNIAKEYGIELDAEKARRDEINKATEQTIQLIKEESAERQRANQLTKAQENYDAQANSARQSLRDSLKTAMTGTDFGIFTTKSDNKEIQQNADAIADIIGSIVETNIMLIAGKTGDEYEKGLDKMFSLIQNRMKAIGISESTISKEWLSSTLFSNTNLVNEYIDNIVRAKNEQDNYVEKIEKNYKVAKKATEATMTFTQKVDANARALRNNTEDAISLYNKIYDIVKIAQQNHTINFDLKLTADNPPKWMLDKSLPELQQLAERFTAIAQSGGRAKGYTNETTYQQGLLYASAARKKQEEEERNARNKDHKKRTKHSDEIAKAIKDEISLVKQLQSAYDTLTKKGDSHANAIAKVQNLYGKTIDLLNKNMDKFGLPRLDLSIIKGNNHNEVLAFFEKLRDVLESKGLSNLERMEAVEGVVKEFRLKADTYNLDMITKGLNNELGKLKDEYELAVELDANPELGDMFADMFGINTSTLPKTFGDALDRAQIIINRKLAEMNITTPFDLMEGNIDSFAKSTGLDKDGAVIKELVSAQKTWQDMFKKNITETEKILDDYIKKYGDYSDKIAEIEANRLEKLRKLNEAYYTEEMRKRPEYAAKLNAIEQGASKEKQQVDFDEFKNSRYYTMMFENLDYISTKTIRDMRDRVHEYIDTAKDLTPEQLKTLISQYEKLEQKVVKRSPFKTLAKDLKAYFKESKNRKEANVEFRNAQKEYDAQKKNVAALKEKYEQAKANTNTSQSYLDFLQIEINGENEILKILKEQLDAAEKKADKYNLTAKLAKSEALQVAQVVGQNLQSLGELRDFLQQDLGIELSDELNGLVDGLSKTGQGINKIISSATSGDIVGVITGVGQTVYGLFDGIASIFGGGSAGDKKIVRQIEESEKAVKRLELTYKNLSHTAEEAYGAMVSGAKKAMQSNKELQLVELKRQLALEKSRDSKHRDEDKIADLEGQIIDLKNEIHDATQDIINDLLDISSAGDGIESLVSVMIDAFRNGEDAMEAFGKEWDKMIDNMILKLIVTQFMKQAWDTVMGNLKKKQEEFLKNPSQAVADAQKEVDRLSTMSDAELAFEIAQKNGTFDAWGWIREGAKGVGVTNNMIENYKKAAQDALTTATEVLNGQSLDYTKWSLDYMNHEGRDYMMQYAEMLKNSLGDWYTYGENNTKELSALQAGIKGITEEQASALEAYWNSNTQQQFLQSDLLTQIRDAVVGFDIDVQTASLSQILLQLQTNYVVMQSMQSMMEGWTTPSGQGIRVELIS